jgi:streptogramin lyase
VCWRLQAKKLKIGFSPAALVWHHHRPSVKAYWRQQAGYGEGETWLEAHHPEKFVRGSMVWHGRIYSRLPFVRSLSGRHINTGVWGTAAFPSVYSTFRHPIRFLPHSPAWLGAATLLAAAGALASFTPYIGVMVLLLTAGALGWSITIGRCLALGWQSNLDGLRTADGAVSRLSHRLLIAWLHFLQPLARFYGRLRGMWSPPIVVAGDRVTRLPWKVPVPSVPDTRATAQLLMGGATEQQFWSESWTSHDGLLTEVSGLLRASRPARHVEVDDGWHADRDVSVAIGRWGWLDVRALIEEHGGSKCLLRVGMRLRPAALGVGMALTLAVLAVSMSRAAMLLRWPSVSVACILFVAGVLVRAAWETTNAVAVARKAIARAAGTYAMAPIPAVVNAAAWKFRPYQALLSQRVQAAVLLVLLASATASSMALMRRTVAVPKPALVAVPAPRPFPMFESTGDVAVATNGEVYFADARRGLIGRLDPVSLEEEHVGTSGTASDPWQVVNADWRFQSPAAVAIAPNGDVYVADAQNSRICRIDRATGMIVTVAGSGASGFDGDFKQATQAALHWPNAVAVGRNGDLYIADTMNHRVRVVSRNTGLIRTIAGDGEPGPDDRAESAAIGDRGPAVRAHLNGPTDIGIAPNGDLYIADMGHNRIRRVDAATGVITTVAGNGRATSPGDGGPAVSAKLAGAAAIALAGSGRRLTIYVAEYFGGNVRVIAPDGSISTLGPRQHFTAPSRLAYRPGGWLYVASENGSMTVVNLSKAGPLRVGTVASRAPAGAPVSVGLQAIQ